MKIATFSGVRCVCYSLLAMLACLHTGDTEYMVALSDRIVTASERALAPDLQPGDIALFAAQQGEEAPVNVVSVDSTVW